MDPTTWQLPYGLVLLSLFCIVMCRSNATYWIGRGVVAGAGHTRWRKVLDSRAYAVGSEWLNRWGPPAVTLSFLVVGVQTMVNLAAGVSRMPMRRYLPAVIVGCVIWAFIYATGGLIGFALLSRAWEHSPPLTILGLLTITGATAAFFIRRRTEPHHPETASHAKDQNGP